MTQTESAPSVDPLSLKELAKKDLHSLELLLGISERNLESKILERDKHTKLYLAMDKEFSALSSAGNEAQADEVRAKCRVAGDKQHELNLDIKKMHDALLPIREAIVAKQNPL